MSVYIKSGSTFTVSNDQDIKSYDKIPGGCYVVQFNITTGQYSLRMADSFSLPSKIYGDTEYLSSRILNTFLDRPNSTGVLLAGEKGSGKTLLVKKVSAEASINGIPTIIINENYHGDNFNQFIQSIDQPAIILFDEFEKVYDREKQEHILTLLDGVFPSKKLFLLTCNNKYAIDDNMRNRPGRIYYMIDYVGLGPEFIREYCDDTLQDKSNTESICKFSMAFDSFNFDMLKAMVEELNRYGGSVKDTVIVLNTKPELSGKGIYEVSFIKMPQVNKFEDQTKTVECNPMCSDIRIDYSYEDEKGETNWSELELFPSDIEFANFPEQSFVYVKTDGVKIKLKKKNTAFNKINNLF